MGTSVDFSLKLKEFLHSRSWKPMVEPAGRGKESFWKSFNRLITCLPVVVGGVLDLLIVEQNNRHSCYVHLRKSDLPQIFRQQLSQNRLFIHSFVILRRTHTLRKWNIEVQRLVLGCISGSRLTKKTPHIKSKAFPRDHEAICRTTFECQAFWIEVFIF